MIKATFMGLTHVQIGVANPARPRKLIRQRFLVDSGAVYSVVQRSALAKLGIEPHSKQQFTLANGDTIERELGDALFEYRGRRGASPVIFGEPGDMSILGMVTLEALGLMLDPIRRELRPLPMILALLGVKTRCPDVP